MSARRADPKRCPICGRPNRCAMAEGKSACWCFHQKVPESVLDGVPAELRGLACVCEACATGKRSPEDLKATMLKLLKSH